MGVELPKIWVLIRPLKTRLAPKGYDLGHFSWISDELGNSLCCDMDPPLESQGPVHICAGSDSSAGLTFVGLVPLSWVVSLLVGNRSFRAQSVLRGAWRVLVPEHRSFIDLVWGSLIQSHCEFGIEPAHCIRIALARVRLRTLVIVPPV